ncbi:RNA polymerase sigma factor [Pelagicoccus mobilis]|uniref:Sigma-70 family RNA polymerase sigma factor n=1 Tax=Pelagicoccus mobilis TaxID=415221 RepID=A0A934S0N4_9BACT|nr:sigma-70 family RNA polymerase sigma factor [Pelagicoccus mobilis]MBK1878834.1 sigma-70 family RNA polymerase sigma factor [Pelagicoccus mobilis]
MKRELAESFFRHEYGKLTATFSRRFGTRYFQDVEDAVQSALLKGMQTWPVSGVPENPSAWLFQVARNSLLGELRKRSNQGRLLQEHSQDFAETSEGVAAPSELQDNLIQMLFISCDHSIPINSQLVFALKALCGFSIQEVATRLFVTEENAYKRYARARRALASDSIAKELSNGITHTQYALRLPSVQKVLYLIFTEGHLSTHSNLPIRLELCQEAIRLSKILAENPHGQSPSTFALIALFHLLSARMSSRQKEDGSLLLLEEQNRSQWDQEQIKVGLEYLAKSATGEEFSRYHAEAGIAAEHCLAPSYSETRWEKIAELYQLLDRVSPSPLHRINRAMAVAEFKGPQFALGELSEFEPPSWLSSSYQYYAVLADLHFRSKKQDDGARFRKLAIDSAPSSAIKKLTKSRLDRY